MVTATPKSGKKGKKGSAEPVASMATVFPTMRSFGSPEVPAQEGEGGKEAEPRIATSGERPKEIERERQKGQTGSAKGLQRFKGLQRAPVPRGIALQTGTS